MGTKKSVIYMDHNATTPVDDRVLQLMLPFFTEKFGNSMSVSHEYGWQADSAVESSRDLVSSLLSCSRTEITWTSGATESNNWGLRGVVDYILQSEKAPVHVLCNPLEHASVILVLEHLRDRGLVDLQMLPITKEGLVEVSEVAKLIQPKTRMLVCMWGQNEVGGLNPIAEVGALCRENQVYLFCDATQAIGKIPIDLRHIHVDLMSFSAHKLYGPKGVGFLYHRKRDPVVPLTPLLFGGGHERGERSGTLNTPGIVGQAQALKIAIEEMDSEARRIMKLREHLVHGLQEHYPDLVVNGPALPLAGEIDSIELSKLKRLPGNLSLTFPSCRVPPHLPGLAFSRGSACDTSKISTSHVLTRLGVSDLLADRSLRLGLGRGTQLKDVEQAIEIIKQHIR